MSEDKKEILLGDSLSIMKQIKSSSIGLIFTSPPYADRRKNTYGGIPENKYVEWITPYIEEMVRVLKPNGSIFINIKPHTNNGERSLYVFDLILHLKRELGLMFIDEFCWTKLGVPGKFNGRFKNAFEPIYHFALNKGFTFNRYAVAEKAKEASLKRYKRKACGESKNGSGFAGMRKEIISDLALPSNHLHIVQKSNQYTIQSNHSAVFPVELSDFFIKTFSNGNDIILDPFAGSGTVAISCIKNKRNYIMIDKEEGNINLIKKRVADFNKKFETQTLFGKDM